MGSKILVVGGAGGGLDTEHPLGWNGTWPYEIAKSEHHFGILSVEQCRLIWKSYDLSHELLDRVEVNKCSNMEK